MSVLATTFRWFRRSLMAAAIVATGALTLGATTNQANAQVYYPYSGYYPYSPYYSYYRPYYPYYYGYPGPYVHVGWGWGRGWRGGWGHGGWGHGGHHH